MIVTTLSVAAACAEGTPDVIDSLHRVRVEQCASPENQWTTAVAVGPDTVATVAHSLTSAEAITAFDATGTERSATIVYLDEAKDVAILRLAGDAGPVLPIVAPASSGPVVVASFADEDGPTRQPSEILELVDATLDGEGRRRAIKLDAEIGPGDSGAPVVNDDGEVVGMIFATARDRRIGWAIAGTELIAAIDELGATTPEALPPVCG